MALSFQEDLQQLLNRHSAESPSGTPDYILAEMLTNVLKTFNEAVGQRAEWRGESVELPAMQKLFDTPSSMDDCAACHSMMDDIREESAVDDDRFETGEVETLEGQGITINIFNSPPAVSADEMFEKVRKFMNDENL